MINSMDGDRLVGYARVSTGGQDLSLQLDALQKHGVAKDLIFTDKASGAKHERPGLDACFRELKPGDVLLVWRLDRLGRSVRHLVTFVDELKAKGIGFRSICDGAIDTTTPSGELIFHVFSALARFERRLIQESTNAGLAAARSRGRIGGRPLVRFTNPRVALARKLYHDVTVNIGDICTALKMSKSTLYRYVTMNGGSLDR